MTNIRALPELQFDFTITNDEDWLDGIAYVTESDPDVPLAIDDIDLLLQVRPSLSYPSPIFTASTDNGLIFVGPASAGSSVNSAWCLNVAQAGFPKFLAPGTYVYGLQGLADGYTLTLASGQVIVNEGAS